MNNDFKDKFENFIPQNYKSVIEKCIFAAENFGVEIFLIGGIVRDLILENHINDIDITVKGSAVDFCINLENFLDCKIINIQENLKTAKVEFNSGIIIDFASTREEYYSAGGQLPIIKNFGCELEKDVKRRDFTINTLAIALTGNKKFRLIDFCGGFEDIKNKKIRILHDKSFIDDPSRIVRALKFQMRFDFQIEEKTYTLMQEYLNTPDVSVPLERIKNELRQYFSINKNNLYENLLKYNAYKLICDTPVQNFNIKAFNEIKPYITFTNIWFIYIALLLLNSDFENPRLNLNTNEKRILRETKKLIADYPININDNLLIYNSFINKSEPSPVIYYLIKNDKSVLKFYEALKQVKILINGNDLINLGFIPSPMFNALFKKILKEKLDGKLLTKEEELKFVKQYTVKNSLNSEV